MSDLNTTKIIEKFHTTASENPIHLGAPSGSWSTREWVYKAIIENLKSTDITLETGAGISTLCFAQSKSSKHYCIVPERQEVENINACASILGLKTSKINYHTQNSGDFLPKLCEQLDFALIDGSHGPLLPFIDFYFIVKNLKPGGIVVLDDLQLLAPKILFEFIQRETAVKVLQKDDWAAMIQIEDNSFINSDWWNSGICYTAHFDIIDDQLLAKAKRFVP